jgi:hypothetical protein
LVYVDLYSLSDLGKGENNFIGWDTLVVGIWYPRSWGDQDDDDEHQQRDVQPSHWLQPTEGSLVLTYILQVLSLINVSVCEQKNYTQI